MGEITPETLQASVLDAVTGGLSKETTAILAKLFQDKAEATIGSPVTLGSSLFRTGEGEYAGSGKLFFFGGTRAWSGTVRDGNVHTFEMK
jgi:hypothetical protein